MARRESTSENAEILHHIADVAAEDFNIIRIRSDTFSGVRTLSEKRRLKAMVESCES
jgi:hypothetical protein